jgi:hypothetical protein
MKWGMRPGLHTHLVIACLDPLLIKVMLPKVTLVVIHSVRFPAVGALGSMGRRSRRGDGSWGGVPPPATADDVSALARASAR